MGKVKELYMDVLETTWTFLESNPTETLETLTCLVATKLGQDSDFISPIVEDAFLEYKESFERCAGAVEAEYVVTA